MKYYAVLKGKVPGIYTTWGEAQAHVSGFKGAVYKSFTTRSAALEFMNQEVTVPSAGEHDADKIYVYTDGSAVRGVAGYGFVVVTATWVDLLLGHVPQKPAHNDVAELMAVEQALLYVQNLHIEVPVVMRSDSTYPIDVMQHYKHWKRDNWKGVANVELVQHIVALAIELNVKFEHVDAHSGIEYNELADQLAKEGRTVTNTSYARKEVRMRQ